jgi:putative ABC transport system permease protein
MFRSHVIVAVRNLFHHKIYALINILGLAVGMGCSLVIFLHIAGEFSYDRQSPGADRTYRLTGEYKRGGRISHSAFIPAVPPLQIEIPEIETSVRLFTYSWREKALLASGAESFYEEGFFLADPAVLDMFAIPLLQGDAGTALADPGRIILSQSAAAKYFGSRDPIGRTLSVKNYTPTEFVVSGIFRDMPENIHFHADFIAPLEAGNKVFWPGFLDRNSFYTYVRLRRGVPASAAGKKLPAVLGRHLGAEAESFVFHLQPLTDIHLRSQLGSEIEANGDLKSVFLLALLAIVILAGSGINFVNLATARSAGRAKEVGLRKVIGARRPQIVRQFLAESGLLTLASVPPAFLLAVVLVPAFNGLLNARVSFRSVPPMTLGLALAGLVIAVGLAAGTYPAFLMSGFAPAEALKRRVQTGSRRSLIRGALVVIQCAGAVTLMAGTLIILSQMRFIQNRKMGFDKEQIVILPLKDSEARSGYPALKAALTLNPEVLHVSASESLPSQISWRHPAWHEGAGSEVEEPILWNAVDYDFLETFGMELAAGRSFSRNFPSDEKRGYIINETAARIFGWARPVGMSFALSNKNLKVAWFDKGEIIGVVKDFHSQSLHKPIEPVVLSIQKDSYRFAAVKVRPGRTGETLASLAGTWKRILPGRPFDGFFFDDSVAKMYASERRIGRAFGAGALLSLFLAALGLFGLASYSAAKRTKEIGIRKTLGASTRDIVLLLSREFAGLFLAANLAAWPIAYVVTQKWLQGFAYRIAAGPSIFLLASAVGLVVLAMSVSSQALKAAWADPADSLRFE